MTSQALKVFLAEDSAPIRQRVAAELSAHALEVVGEGETPVGCIEGILASHPDVVVLDIHLVGGTGLQVLRAVRAAEPEVAFVVFSNASEPAYRRRYLAEGAARFLDKNTEFDQLVDAVQSPSQPLHH
jgi:two-component system response regulator DesR